MIIQEWVEPAVIVFDIGSVHIAWIILTSDKTCYLHVDIQILTLPPFPAPPFPPPPSQMAGMLSDRQKIPNFPAYKKSLHIAEYCEV